MRKQLLAFLHLCMLFCAEGSLLAMEFFPFIRKYSGQITMVPHVDKLLSATFPSRDFSLPGLSFADDYRRMLRLPTNLL